ncbi:hypothetical protein ABI59_02485 [Acidobacteria bacterium Mor1]|nr:hypothetical protein ABI59_02485 [Acidobacteria bacterium Mor1]
MSVLAVVGLAAAVPAWVLTGPVAIVASLLCVAGAAFWAQGRLMRPIDRLAVAADRIVGEQDYTTRLKCDRHGEFRGIASALNGLLDEIQQRELAMVRAGDEAREVLDSRLLALQQQIDDEKQHSRLKSEFIRTISHEIRGPLDHIIGSTQLAMESVGRRELHDYLRSVKPTADHLLHILNNVLDLSRLESGRIEVDRIPFSLRGCVGDTVRTLGYMAEGRGLELQCHIPENLPDALLGDPGRIRQLVVNLAQSRLGRTSSGEVSVRVRLEPVTDSTVLHFEVSAPGGAAADPVEQALLSGEQPLGGAEAWRNGANGLGLSISRKLVDLLGGRLWSSTDGPTGYTIHFTVPVELQEARDAARPRHIGSTRLQDMRVLVVDDNETSRRMVCDLLSGWGMQVVQLDGSAAAEQTLIDAALAHEPFEFAIIDADMPGIDGFELCRRIRESRDVGETPILLLSPVGRMGDGARCRELCIDGYLTKPVSSAELLGAIRTILGYRAGTASGEELVTRHSLRETRLHLHILVAEQDDVQRMVTRRMLRKRGHTVLAVGSGKEVLEQVDDTQFDLLLLDLDLADLDGYQVARGVRGSEAESGRRLPIVGLGRTADEGERLRSSEAGIDAVVAKPIDAQRLERAIEQSVGDAQRMEFHRTEFAGGGSLIDPAVALDRAGGNTAELSEQIEVFLDVTPGLLDEIRTGIDRGDASVVEQASNRLSGSLESFGAGPAADTAFRLERVGREGHLDQAEQALDVLEDQLSQVRRELSALGQRG